VILTDPPYGRREWLGGGGGTSSQPPPPLPQPFASAPGALAPLLALAARCLRAEGTLAFFLPVAPAFVLPAAPSRPEEEGAPVAAAAAPLAELAALLPSHPALRLSSVTAEGEEKHYE
jgi:hypothetical protein